MGRKEQNEMSESGGNHRGSLRERLICECHRGPLRAVSGQVGGEEADVGCSGFKRPET